MSNIASSLAPNARSVGFTAAGTVSANNVQAAIAELDTEKSPTTHTTHVGEAVSQAASGYKKFADGTILQWGVVLVSANQSTISFPISFLSAVYGIYGTGRVSSGGATRIFTVLEGQVTASQFQFELRNNANVSITGENVYWYAVGR